MIRILITIVIVVTLAGCQMPNRQMAIPSKMPDGKWISFSWYSSQGGDIRSHMDSGIANGYALVNKLNSNAYKHERYMSTIRIPALTQFEWQQNAKAMNYWIGKYGVLPPGVLPK
jgi:hypothetical protein